MTFFTKKEILTVPFEKRQAMLDVNEKYFAASIDEVKKEIAELDKRVSKKLDFIRYENARRAKWEAMTSEQKEEKRRIMKAERNAMYSRMDSALAGLFEN